MIHSMRRSSSRAAPPAFTSPGARDALSRNTPKLEGFTILLANCLAHYLDSCIIRSDCEIGAPAGVGDLFMSLIYTCAPHGANLFEYLTELQRHSAELCVRSAEWMPWNYRETLMRLTKPAAA